MKYFVYIVITLILLASLSKGIGMFLFLVGSGIIAWGLCFGVEGVIISFLFGLPLLICGLIALKTIF